VSFDVLLGVIVTRVGRFFRGFDGMAIRDGRCRLGMLALPVPLGRTKSKRTLAMHVAKVE
jgi:hypothetical protein